MRFFAPLCHEDENTRRVQTETVLFKQRANQHRERAAATERT